MHLIYRYLWSGKMKNKTKMNKTIKKTIKITAISLLSLFLIIIAVIAFAIHFIFTPERLTPVVVNTANKTLDAKLDMQSVELTFFSTFPRFGLKLTDGTLVSKAIRDTLWQKTDSLLSFKKCVLVVNPIDYLEKQKISLHYLLLDSVSVYAYTSPEGISNWDIAPSDTTEKAPADTTSFTLPGGIDIRRISFRHTNLTFDDRNTHLYARLDDANLQLRASLQKGRSLLGLEFDNKNVIFWQNGQLLLHRISTRINTKIAMIRRLHLLALKDTRFTVNGIDLDINGTVQRDTLQKALNVNLKYGLHAPSLETVLAMIPESILKKEEVSAQGEVKLEGTLKGLYGKKQMPLATLKVQINEASAKYDRLPYGIDNITADFYGELDLMRRQPSFADLKIFRFQGAHTDILADALVEDLLGDPRITLNTKSTIDMTALAQTFPLQEGVKIEGKMDADIRLKCKLSSIRNKDLGRMKIGGKLNMEGLALRDSVRDFEFTGDASLGFFGNESLGAKGEIRQLKLHYGEIDAALDKFSAQVKTTNPQDTTRIVDLECRMTMDRLKASMTDTMKVFCKKTTINVHLQPASRNPLRPKVNLSLQADTFFCRMSDLNAGMNKAGFAVEAEQVRDSFWLPKGIIGFNRLKLRTPQLALPVVMEKTALTVGNRQITLRNATMRIGRSDLTASGSVHDLYRALKKNTVLKANLEISSNNLNCNQLLRAFSTPGDSAEVEAIDTAATTLSLFVIPPTWNFELQTNLKRVRYGRMLFENVHGAVDIRNQAMHLKELSMIGLDGATMKSTLVYQAAKKEKGYVGFDLRLKDVNIGKLVDFIPALDSMVPMLRSFKGYVNFDVAAESDIDSLLNIQIPTLRSAINLQGDSLVLMDGETFAEISKKLMFKNKERNVFDHISANITVDNGNVTVYPFLVEIDRYRAAVGGTQDLNMNFDYHISILKSPLPFKAGVNISGTLDDMKIRIGKAKYKDAVTPVEIRKVDSTRINMGTQIVQDFRRIMRRP